MKTKNIILLILVTGLAFGAQAERLEPKAGSLFFDRNQPTELFIKAIGLQYDDSSYIVYIEMTDEGQQQFPPSQNMYYLPAGNITITHAQSKNIHLLPEPMTIVLLGFAGLLFGPRTSVRYLPSRI